MFNPGDLVQLSSKAVMENIRRDGRLFPDLTADSIFKVKEQRKYSVYIETESEFHSVIHEMWLIPAVAYAE